MRCKCGHQATVFEDAAGYELAEPMRNLCFIDSDRETEALVARVIVDEAREMKEKP